MKNQKNLLKEKVKDYINNIPDEYIMFESKRKKRKPPYYSPSEVIPGISEIVDKERNETRTIKYVPTASTIFVDEMSETEKEKDPFPFRLENGLLMVRKFETNKLMYLLLCGYNEANLFDTNGHCDLLFRLKDITSEAKNYSAKEARVAEAIMTVRDFKADEVRALALAMAKGKRSWQSILSEKIDYHRANLISIAKKSPESILRALETDSSVKNRYWIARAVTEGIVNYHPDRKEIRSKDDSELIIDCQAGDVIDHMAEVATRNAEVFNLVEEWRKQLNPNAEEDENFDLENNVEKSTLDIIIEKLDRRGILTRDGSWYYINKGEENEERAQGKSNLRELFHNKPSLLVDLEILTV